MSRKPYIWEQYTWEEQASWLKEEARHMTFALCPLSDTICTGWWYEGESSSVRIFRFAHIVQMFLGAYPSAPTSDYHHPEAGFFAHTSFGFWNTELLSNARRVLPLPNDLRAGPLRYLGGGREEDRSGERIYNRRVHDLPHFL